VGSLAKRILKVMEEGRWYTPIEIARRINALTRRAAYVLGVLCKEGLLEKKVVRDTKTGGNFTWYKKVPPSVNPPEVKEDLLVIINALGSPVRFQIIEKLRDYGGLPWSKLKEFVLPEGSEGNFHYHLKTLARAGLINYDSLKDLYYITPLGKRALHAVNSLKEGR